jgi:hypothetical protein
MSREDDEIDYRMMYPISGRTRKRSSNPRTPKPKPEPYGFFTRNDRNEPPPTPAKDQGSKARAQSQITKRYDDDDTRPKRSMKTVAREMLAKDLDISLKEMCRKLDARGYEAAPVTIGAIRQEMFAVLRLCEKHGSIVVAVWQD